MLDPKEMKKGGFAAFSALFSERWAARHPAPSPESSQTAPTATTAATAPAPTVDVAPDGAAGADVPR